MIAEVATHASSSPLAALTADLAAIVGPDGVRDDAATTAFYSEDIWAASPETVALVVSPRSLDEVQRVVAAAHAAGVAMAPRGGGMSYTSSYVPVTGDTISLDMARMDHILAIRPDDMTVTVEAGCTWAALYEALKAKGLRTPFWGAMSGLASTIGGGLSQLNAMFGAGHYGTSSESVVGLAMVLADGTILRTGAGGDAPFYRHYGPDLTGIFCGDCGVFGIKTEITLRLIRMPAHEDYASFSFSDGQSLIRALAEITRAGIACETCGFDPNITGARMKRDSLASDVKTLGKVIGAEKSLGKGLLAAAKVALGGRDFIAAGDYPLHIIAEGRSAAGVAADMAEVRRIAAAEGGKETANTVARVIRANPFPPLNSTLGPDGELWNPVHGMVRLSEAADCFTAIMDYFGQIQPRFDAHGIWTGFLFTAVSTNAIMLEPVFYWPGARRPIQEYPVEAAHLAKLPRREAYPAADAIVAEARRRVIAIFEGFNAGHFQIGRTYPYRSSRDAASKALLDTLKDHLDPGHRLNPGGLGFS